MQFRRWWGDTERRRRWNKNQERASDAKFYTLLIGLGCIGVCVVGDWLGFWTFFIVN